MTEVNYIKIWGFIYYKIKLSKIKLIKTKKISKLEIQRLVEAKCGFKIKESIFKTIIFSRNLSNFESSEKKGFSFPTKLYFDSDITKKSTNSHSTLSLYSKISTSL